MDATAAWWIEAARAVGVPGAVLLILALGSWRLLARLAPRLEKIADEYLELMNVLKDSIRSIDGRVTALHRHVQVQTEKLDRLERRPGCVAAATAKPQPGGTGG